MENKHKKDLTTQGVKRQNLRGTNAQTTPKYMQNTQAWIKQIEQSTCVKVTKETNNFGENLTISLVTGMLEKFTQPI